jgi:hypothetical protein
MIPDDSLIQQFNPTGAVGSSFTVATAGANDWDIFGGGASVVPTGTVLARDSQGYDGIEFVFTAPNCLRANLSGILDAGGIYVLSSTYEVVGNPLEAQSAGITLNWFAGSAANSRSALADKLRCQTVGWERTSVTFKVADDAIMDETKVTTYTEWMGVLFICCTMSTDTEV